MAAPLRAGKPEAAKSAVALKSKYTVQHRSDLLMKEHIQNVRASQEALKVAINSLDNAKTKAEMEQWTITASELKNKTEQLVLVLQVMRKLNTELAYARSDLNEALYKGIGDINAARKRVIWLEDKMGELCGRKRLKSRPINRLHRDYDSGSDSDEGRPLDSAERIAHGDRDRERTRSLAQILGSDFGLTSTDTEMKLSGGRLPDSSDSHGIRGVDFSDDYGKLTDASVKPLDVSHQPRRSIHHGFHSSLEISPRLEGAEGKEKVHRHLYASMTTLTSGQEDIAEESSGDFSPLKEVSVPDTSEATGSVGGEDGDIEASPENWQQEHHIPAPPESDEEESEESEGDSDGSDSEEDTEEGSPVHHLEPDSQYEADTPKTPQSRGQDGFSEDEEEEEEEEESSEEEKKEEGEEGDKGQVQKTFITEVGVVDTKGKTPVSKPHVKIESPRKEAVKEIVPEEPEDIGTAYWQSEHHRFEYSKFSRIFGDDDPLSYHKVGLAVPGSFLRRCETDFTDLPWKTTLTAKDIKDIHREALDKLAFKVHNMQEKIYNAAQLSVRRKPPPVDGPPEASFLQNIDKAASDAETAHPGLPKKPSTEMSKAHMKACRLWETCKSLPVNFNQHHQLTQESMAVPKFERQSTNTSTPSRLIFYPKTIPPPQVLPITRTNHNKEFPQFASSFAEPDPDQRAPAERLVDQRNLMEETKLVLYRQKPKPNTPGPSSMERRFRKMIERDTSQSQKSSAAIMIEADYYRKKVRSQFRMAAALTSMQTSVGTWKQIKPRSRGHEYQGLRWERVKTIVHRNLNSERAEERMDAAKQLGLLRCGDTMVFYALKERAHRDSDQRVRYEATKALILIGCWEDEVLRVVLKYLVLGNTEMRIDLINTLIDGKNVMYVDKTIPTFLELVKVLSHFCRNPDPEDQIAFSSAVLLGRLCVRDASAEARLMKALEEPSDCSHTKAKALDILVKQLGKIDAVIVDQILHLLKSSHVWKHRVLATKLMISLGPKQKFVLKKQEEIYGLLTRRLWDDPSSEVRLSAAKALTALGMFARACEAVENRLEDPDEKLRAEAVISVGTLGMKNEHVIRLLLEMLELDSSEYVRLMIIRTFSTLNLTDRRILRTLREREKLEGPLARESKKALRSLDSALQTPVSRSVSVRGLTPKPFTSRRAGLLTPITG
ncbi:uncharacterized protein [Littorina saxatilis]|uniref:uncharacterized protein isoform X2 n=1 Tax=Littorina saxatilis TaxID=31220 RepID=UPI0038B5D69B